MHPSSRPTRALLGKTDSSARTWRSHVATSPRSSEAYALSSMAWYVSRFDSLAFFASASTHAAARATHAGRRTACSATICRYFLHAALSRLVRPADSRYSSVSSSSLSVDRGRALMPRQDVGRLDRAVAPRARRRVDRDVRFSHRVNHQSPESRARGWTVRTQKHRIGQKTRKSRLKPLERNARVATCGTHDRARASQRSRESSPRERSPRAFGLPEWARGRHLSRSRARSFDSDARFFRARDGTPDRLRAWL